MFFAVKSVFWLSVVALMMPDADIDAAKVVQGARQLAAAAAPAALESVGAKCVATAHCRAVLTQMIRAALEEDAAPAAALRAGPAAAKPAAVRPARAG